MGRFHTDLLGKVFGKLTVICFDRVDNGGNAKWLCECWCGKHTVVHALSLVKENGTRSCGCLNSATQRRYACQRGHAFTLENTIVGKNNRRTCRTCKSANEKTRQGQHNQYLREHPELRLSYENARRARKTSAGGSFTPEEWIALCDKYEHKCVRCKRRRKLTADHVIPVSKGGTSSIENIQPLCKPCNSWKHTQSIDFRKEKNLCH
jgi:hypothetical protein